MSDISRTTAKVAPQQTQATQGAKGVQEQPKQESLQRFQQKLKGKEEPKKSKAEGKQAAKQNLEGKNLSSVMRQAQKKAQEKAQTKEQPAGAGKPSQEEEQAKGLQKLTQGKLTQGKLTQGKLTQGKLTQEKSAQGKSTQVSMQKDSMPSLSQEREEKKPLAQKADAILQGLQPPAATQPQQQVAAALGTQSAEQTQAPAQGSDRLFQEFQTVAERVMHTSQGLQQGGSVRLQLSNSVLPGTSVTFSMVAGSLHVAFSGNNKKSLDKIRDHKDGLVAHVRNKSGIAIVVETKDEDSEQQQQRGYP